jgi:hypothetical protein
MRFLRSLLGPQLSILAAGVAVVFAIHNAGDAGPIDEDDTDGIPDPVDNCVLVPNADQGDSDLDGYGNPCDSDYDNNALVAGGDFLTFQTDFNTSAPTYNEQVDQDCNGLVAGGDFLTFQANFNQPPGPSGLACAGTVPCPPTAHGCP